LIADGEDNPMAVSAARTGPDPNAFRHLNTACHRSIWTHGIDPIALTIGFFLCVHRGE